MKILAQILVSSFTLIFRTLFLAARIASGFPRLFAGGTGGVATFGLGANFGIAGFGGAMQAGWPSAVIGFLLSFLSVHALLSLISKR